MAYLLDHPPGPISSRNPAAACRKPRGEDTFNRNCSSSPFVFFRTYFVPFVEPLPDGRKPRGADTFTRNCSSSHFVFFRTYFVPFVEPLPDGRKPWRRPRQVEQQPRCRGRAEHAAAFEPAGANP